jgi:hypothetical protein
VDHEESEAILFLIKKRLWQSRVDSNRPLSNKLRRT